MIMEMLFPANPGKDKTSVDIIYADFILMPNWG